MLIESVHIMDDAEGIAFGIAPSLVWLHFADKGKNFGICNPLYFSLVSADFVFRNWLFPVNGELDCGFEFNPVLSGGEMPSYVVKTRTQLMNDFAAQDAKTLRDDEVSMIADRILPLLRVRIGDDRVLASFEESHDFIVKVTDALIGPF